MRPSIPLLSLAVCLSLMPAALADTAVNVEASSGANIFSTPDASDAASFSQVPAAGPGVKLRQALLGNTRDGIPDFRQIQMLPTLSLEQRRQLRELNKGNKVKVQDLVEQLKKLKEQRDTAGGAVSAEMRSHFEDIRSQLQALRKQSWEQSKSYLTEAQIHDLQAMKHGELQPSTFHSETSSNELMTGQ